MKSVRWGVLGTASMAKRRAIPAIQNGLGGEVLAIASRDANRAALAAHELGIPRSYGSYAELLADADIDAVYVPLTNDLHCYWSVRAIKAGKHVLCEKPLALSAAEVQQIRDAAQTSNVMVMEGLTSHFHPVHQRAATLVHEGRIGKPGMLQVSLGWSLVQRVNDFRWQKAHGGGGLFDLGGYCIHTARLLFGSDPTTVSAQAVFRNGVDVNIGITLCFPDERLAVVNCGILSAMGNRYELSGTDGRITVYDAFGNGAEGRKLTICDGYGKVVHEEFPTVNQLQEQFNSFNNCILEGKPVPVSLNESWKNACIIDACLQSAESGGASVEVIY